MRSIFSAVALVLAAASPVAAQTGDAPVAATPPAAKAGMLLRDSGAARVGQVTRVLPSGSVEVIFDSRLIIVPAATLSIDESGKLKTSLTRAEVRKIK